LAAAFFFGRLKVPFRFTPDCRVHPTQPASREDHQVEKCQTNPRDAEFFLQQTSAANCGAPTTPPIPSSPTAWQSPFLVLLFHIRKSAPFGSPVRSRWRGLPNPAFFYFVSRFLAAHKKLHSFKPSKRQMAQCPAAMAPLRQPSVAGVAGFRSWCPYRQAGRDREEGLNLLAQSLLAYLHPGRLGYRSSLPRRG